MTSSRRNGSQLPDPELREHRAEAIHQLERWDRYTFYGSKPQAQMFRLILSVVAGLVYALLEIADAIRAHTANRSIGRDT